MSKLSKKSEKQEKVTSSHFMINEEEEEGDTLSEEESKKVFVNTAKALFNQDNIENYTDEELLTWLSANGNHRGKAFSALQESLNFFNTINKKEIGDFEKHFNDSGLLQFLGKARDGTPNLWCNLDSLVSYLVIPNSTKSEEDEILTESTSNKKKKKIPAPIKILNLLNTIYKDANGKEKVLLYILNFLNKSKKEGIFKGKITLIIDRGQTSEPNLSIMRYLIPIFQNHFPERLNKLIIFPVSGAASYMLWSAAKVTMYPSTVSKVVVSESSKELFNWIDNEEKLERYGGTLVDPVNKYKNNIKSNNKLINLNTPSFIDLPNSQLNSPQLESLNVALTSEKEHNLESSNKKTFFNWASVSLNSSANLNNENKKNASLIIEPDEIIWCAPDELLPEEKPVTEEDTVAFEVSRKVAWDHHYWKDYVKSQKNGDLNLYTCLIECCQWEDILTKYEDLTGLKNKLVNYQEEILTEEFDLRKIFKKVEYQG
ncbi:hypothetical protein HDU92_007501, partial [Lobulomyces angularis]